MGTFSIWHWLVVLAIVLIIFGTKKIRNLGGDLGSAIRNFRDAMKGEEGKADEAGKAAEPGTPSGQIGSTSGKVVEGEVVGRSTDQQKKA